MEMILLNDIDTNNKSFEDIKHILQCKQENKRLSKKNIVC